MARVGVETADDERTQRTRREVLASRGFISHAMEFMSMAPEALAANVAYGHALRFQNHLTELQSEIVICATVRSVDYAWVHHSGLLRRLGVMDQAQIEELHGGQVPSGIGAADAAMARFVFAYVAGAPIPDEVVGELLQHFTREQMVEACLLSSHYLGIGCLLLGFEIELETKQQLNKELEWQDKRLAGDVPSVRTANHEEPSRDA